MYTFVASVLAFVVANAQQNGADSQCIVCWDGSIGKFEDGLCKCPECVTCWDGSVGVLTDGICQCPPIPVIQPEEPEPEVVDEPEPVPEVIDEPKQPASGEESNPNCTIGNRDACDNSGGEWDFTTCFCTFDGQQTEEQPESDEG